MAQCRLSSGHWVVYLRYGAYKSRTSGSTVFEHPKVDGEASDGWILYDDATVTPVSWATVASAEATMLFYNVCKVGATHRGVPAKGSKARQRQRRKEASARGVGEELLCCQPSAPA